MKDKGDQFLWQSKINYLKNITPSNKEYFDTEEYKALIAIGREFLSHGHIKEFMYFFREGQYFIPLWVAHIILQYGNPSTTIKEECLEIITEYSQHPINMKIALEETEWLKANLEKFAQR